ncbi:MAG: hypothetical protein PHI12_11315 [Dehalococcoidales bacterium]|nr:hypothetical protein [Dehalococcoidales bacterium]
MPTFIPGSTHTAHVTFTLKPSGMAGTVHLFLATKDAANNPVTVAVNMAEVSFTSTGASQRVDIPGVVMPAAGTLAIYAFADVKIGGVSVYPLFSETAIDVLGGSGGGISWD